jgi:ketosteroid isomerase-like protein
MTNIIARLALTLVGLVAFATAFAQEVRDDEADVLLTIERAWEANRKGDHDDFDKMLMDNFMGWTKASPAPRSKTSTSRWHRLNDEVGRVMRYELYPLWVTVQDDVAVAHYLYSVALKNQDGDIEMSNGRYSDVLMRTEEGWKFLAWHGGRDN